MLKIWNNLKTKMFLIFRKVKKWVSEPWLWPGYGYNWILILLLSPDDIIVPLIACIVTI